MAGYADELSVKLTAKDEMSAKLRAANKELQAAAREVTAARREFEKTGTPEAAAEVKRLSAQWEKLAKAQQDAARASKEANAALKKTQSEAGKATTALGRMGQSITKRATAIRNAGLVAGAAMLLLAKQSIQAFAAAEKQQVMLNQAYARFPKIQDVTRASFDALNTSIMNLTGTDDDALAGAEALLARFDLTGKQIQQLMPLIADYAIATGQDMSQATTTIGKAMLGNAKALKSLGINYKATGDRARDYSSIMAILEQQVGGVGAAFGESTQGQLAIANQNLENLKETVGLGLVPALQTAVSVMQPVVAFLTGLPMPAQQVGFAITAIGVAAMIATPRILALNTALSARGGILGVAKGAKGAAAGIAAIGAAMIAVQVAKGDREWLADLTGDYQDLGMALRDIVQPGWKGLALQNPIDAIGASLFGFRPALDAANDKVSEFDSTLAKLVSEGKTAEAQRLFDSMVKGAEEWGGTVDDVRRQLPAYTAATQAAVAPTSELADELGSVTIFASRARARVVGLTTAIGRLQRVAGRQQALAAFKKSVKDFVEKPSKEAAYATIDAFTTAASQFKDGSAAQANFVLSNYATIKRTITSSGLSKELRRQLLAPLTAAKNEAIRVREMIALIHGKTIRITYTGGTPTNPGGYHRAGGGAVFGPGTGTSDSIPAMLSNGEYVLRAAAAQRLGYANLDRLNRADKVPVLPPIVNAPAITLPSGSVGRDAPLVGQMVVHASQQVDVELALAREARRQERDRRTRMAGTR